jgi:pilus assembly protein Flp/PilA
MMERLTLWMTKSYARFEELRSEEGGQALVEYALILALIAVVSIAVLTTLGQNVAAKLGDIATAIGGA